MILERPSHFLFFKVSFIMMRVHIIFHYKISPFHKLFFSFSEILFTTDCRKVVSVKAFLIASRVIGITRVIAPYIARTMPVKLIDNWV